MLILKMIERAGIVIALKYEKGIQIGQRLSLMLRFQSESCTCLGSASSLLCRASQKWSSKLSLISQGKETHNSISKHEMIDNCQFVMDHDI